MPSLVNIMYYLTTFKYYIEMNEVHIKVYIIISVIVIYYN